MIAADISFWTFMWYAFAGLVIGVLARLFMPGHQDMNIFVTIVLGVVSAILGADPVERDLQRSARHRVDRRHRRGRHPALAVLALRPEDRRRHDRVGAPGYTSSMPLYEYECSACGALFERLRSMSDDAPACPSCESVHVMRRISMFAASTSSGGFRSSAPSGGGCACGGSCMCGGH